GFRVEGNRILDPDGERFTVKGVVAPYGTFAGGDGGGLAERNERHAAADFDRMRELGINTVKIYVTPSRMLGERARARLDRVVQAARDRDLLVILTGFWGRPHTTGRWVRTMARTYRDDAWVWLLPMNEPGCTGPDTSDCGDWEAWQRSWRAYVRVIRAAGMESPIVVNAPGWSWNLSQVESYPLRDDQLVLGAHRYANDQPSFHAGEREEVERSWARLARERPVLLDEVGNWDGPNFANSPAWTRGMVDFAARWVREEEGAGVVAFNWRWSDPNSLTRAGGKLTGWGRTFLRGYLRKVDAGE
ncbi:MAG: glycoside hydrolase family 5 protein, partial [Pseudonocardiaceae bacterium]